MASLLWLDLRLVAYQERLRDPPQALVQALAKSREPHGTRHRCPMPAEAASPVQAVRASSGTLALSARLQWSRAKTPRRPAAAPAARARAHKTP